MLWVRGDYVLGSLQLRRDWLNLNAGLKGRGRSLTRPVFTPTLSSMSSQPVNCAFITQTSLNDGMLYSNSSAKQLSKRFRPLKIFNSIWVERAP